MKKLLFLILLFPTILFAQKVKNQDSGQTGDLKDFAGKYCTIIIERANPIIKQIQTDADTWDFIEPSSGTKLKLKSFTSVINYMDSNGWQFTLVYVDQFQFMIFKKKE